jgi:hypothetical protein
MASDLFFSSDYIFQQIASSRDTARRSEELLRETQPNTFAGRKTQEPFPVDDPKRPGIEELIDNELQPKVSPPQLAAIFR